MAHQGFGKVVQNLQSLPTDFYDFRVKNTHLSTLFVNKGRTAPVSAVSNRQYKVILAGLPKSLGMS